MKQRRCRKINTIRRETRGIKLLFTSLFRMYTMLSARTGVDNRYYNNINIHTMVRILLFLKLLSHRDPCIVFEVLPRGQSQRYNVTILYYYTRRVLSKTYIPNLVPPKCDEKVRCTRIIFEN